MDRLGEHLVPFLVGPQMHGTGALRNQFGHRRFTRARVSHEYI
jgi:hypothetical protein